MLQLSPVAPGFIGMKVIGVFFVWCLLLVLCWPLALLALLLAPLVWLITLPFRLAGVCIGAVFAFIKALLFLPARLLGGPAKA
jgi:hypothetical protein